MVPKPPKKSQDSPFASLKGLKKALHEEELRYTPKETKQNTKEELTEEDLFAHAMHGTQPLDESKTVPPPKPPPNQIEEVSLSTESATPRFKKIERGSTIEASLVDLGPQKLRKLKRGQIAYEAKLDLHGHTMQQARRVLEDFVDQAVADEKRCVLIVHGKGNHSQDGTPVLKNQMYRWLCEGVIAHMILAFTSALPADGGTGAIYILLRRSKRTKSV